MTAGHASTREPTITKGNTMTDTRTNEEIVAGVIPWATLVTTDAAEIVAALAAAGRLVTPETTQWGVQHSQGIRWESSERAAREWMAVSVQSDQRIQCAYRGRVRLVRRYLGPVEVVENPYEKGATS